MTSVDGVPPRPGTAAGPVCRDSLAWSLLEAASRVLARRGCEDLDDVPGGLVVPGGPADELAGVIAGGVDADAVAQQFVDHYPAHRYPAVVLGSAHGAAVHLAAAVGAPWLPAGFTVSLPWTGTVDNWGYALERGLDAAHGLLAGNPGVTVRQVHDPVGSGPACASVLTLVVRWRRLPPAYREFLRDRLEPGAPALVLRDIRTWPVVDLGGRHTFQVGSPVGGWSPADYSIGNPLFARLLRGIGGEWWTPADGALPSRYAETGCEPGFMDGLPRAGRTHHVLYPNPGALSECVAGLHRDWLAEAGAGDDRCVVETGRLLDPWHVQRAGLVPYWCESASRRAVADAEWWLAGSEPFATVDVLPSPPGFVSEAHAPMSQWRAAAAFARSHGRVDLGAARRYPMKPLPTSHAARALRRQPGRGAARPPVPAADALAGIRRHGEQAGLLLL
jgi:hypothetical protein